MNATRAAMDATVLRSEYAEVEAHLARAVGGDEVRRLRARKVVLEKKLRKVYERERRANDGVHPSHKRRA